MAFDWTPKVVAELKVLWDGKEHSASEIAAALSRDLTRNAVLGKVHRLGLDNHQTAKKPRAPRKRYQTFARTYLPKPKLVRATTAKVKPVTLMDLEPHHCRFPVTADKPHMFCAETKMETSSYCVKHYNKCHDHHTDKHRAAARANVAIARKTSPSFKAVA